MGIMKKSTGFALRPFNGRPERRSTGGGVFSPLASSPFVIPATDQAAVPFPGEVPITAGNRRFFRQMSPVVKEFSTFRLA